MKNNNGVFEDYIERARNGRMLWLKYVDLYQIDKATQILLLPSNNKQYNIPALKYLNEYCEKRLMKQKLIFTIDTDVINIVEQYCPTAKIVSITEEEAKAIMQFYCLYEFSTNLVIASLEEPAGRMGKNIMGKNGITEEEAVAAILYGLFK